jgi:hypothetical protein
MTDAAAASPAEIAAQALLFAAVAVTALLPWGRW